MYAGRLTTSCTVGRGLVLGWLAELGMMGAGARELIVAEYRVTGLSPTVIAELVAEVGPLWYERHQARLTARPRRRAVGAGAEHRLVFVDRLLATLVSLRHGTTHDVLACWFGVDRSTITHAIGEVRPLLAQRGCTVAPDVRLCTLAEVVEYLGADGRTGIVDGTEIRVRRPAAGRKDRDKFVSGKTKQNAVKPLVLTDAEGRVLFCSPVRPGSCADITQARQLGLAQLLSGGPFMEILADAGYQDMGAQTGGRVVTPPHRKFKWSGPRPDPAFRPLQAVRSHTSPRGSPQTRAKSRGRNFPLFRCLSMSSRLCPVSSGIRRHTNSHAATLNIP